MFKKSLLLSLLVPAMAFAARVNVECKYRAEGKERCIQRSCAMDMENPMTVECEGMCLEMMMNRNEDGTYQAVATIGVNGEVVASPTVTLAQDNSGSVNLSGDEDGDGVSLTVSVSEDE